MKKKDLKRIRRRRTEALENVVMMAKIVAPRGNIHEVIVHRGREHVLIPFGYHQLLSRSLAKLEMVDTFEIRLP